MSLKNLVILTGNVGQDAEVNHIGDKSSVASFSLATTEYYTKNGEKVQETQWHKVIAWNRLADFCSSYVVKGTMLQVMGTLKYRTYDSNGVKKYVTEIVADRIEFVGKKVERDEGSVEDNESTF